MTVEELRIEIATVLVRLGAVDDGDVLFEWHQCIDAPVCRAAWPMCLRWYSIPVRLRLG